MSARIIFRHRRTFLTSIFFFALIVLLLLLHKSTYRYSSKPAEESQIANESHNHQSKELRHYIINSTAPPITNPRLAVLVPFRDRFDELFVFVPHLTKFLYEQHIRNFNIFILNQSGRYRFNRGALANVGFLLTKNQSDYIAIHDVDLLPINKNLSYAFPGRGPYHLSSPEYHPQYNYSKYFGGILLISNNHFELVNGMSNRYFGWGLEDDEFFTRIKAAKLSIFRPEKLATSKNDTFLHIHYNRKRDTFKTKEQRDVLMRRDRITGLSDIRYSITSKHDLTIDGRYNCTIFNIELHCDTKQNPWCLHGYVHHQVPTTAKYDRLGLK